jgi:methionine salvage enolase-phosphatase E1
MFELYDMGRTTHKAVPGMYDFIVNNAEKYVGDYRLSEELKNQAKLRELRGHSIPQEYFSVMCDIWTKAYRDGRFIIDIPSIVFPDTTPRFKKVKAGGSNIGILTSASREFTDILYSLPVDEGRLSDYIDEYFLGEQIGDKDFPETFANLWENMEGNISTIFDDKPSVCKAAAGGLRMAGGSSGIYLVDRKHKYAPDVIEELEGMGVKKITSFDDVGKIG